MQGKTRREEKGKRETEESEREERQRKKEREEKKEKKEKKKREKERKMEEKRKQGRPKKGKQPVQAAMESPGSSSESVCEVRTRSQRGSSLLHFGQTPAQRVRLTVASSVGCAVPENPGTLLQSFFEWTVETVVTGFIPPVHLVTTAAHASIFV